MKQKIFGILAIILLINIISCFPKSKEGIKTWFDESAKECSTTDDIHRCSRWFASQSQFKEIVHDGMAKLNPPIKDKDSVFELGVGVGAALKVIQDKYKNIKVGGSDISETAIEMAKKFFPDQAQNFVVNDMEKRHAGIANKSYDHVISFGALAMYLTKDGMIKAFEEALRIVKPGGSLLFTNFVRPGGSFVGSIVEPVSQKFVKEQLERLGATGVRFYPMKHQGDRYQVAFRKAK